MQNVSQMFNFIMGNFKLLLMVVCNGIIINQVCLMYSLQVGRRIESVVVPLEQLKSSDFTDQQEYDTYKMK
ncbi:hypothetical protein CerSpe_239750 [Prunus speciosa]